MGDVTELPVVTKLDIPPERVLAAAGRQDLRGVVVIGWAGDDQTDFYFASGIADGPEVLWLLERARRSLMDIEARERGE